MMRTVTHGCGLTARIGAGLAGAVVAVVAGDGCDGAGWLLRDGAGAAGCDARGVGSSVGCGCW